MLGRQNKRGREQERERGRERMAGERETETESEKWTNVFYSYLVPKIGFLI